MVGSEAGEIHYLDTSVVMHIALGHSHAAATWFRQRHSRGDAFVTSRLTRLEATRVLRRESLSLGLADNVLDVATMLSVDNSLLVEAGALRIHVKSLDALHLASAARVGVGLVTVVTNDQDMYQAAQVLGFDVYNPVEEQPA